MNLLVMERAKSARRELTISQASKMVAESQEYYVLSKDIIQSELGSQNESLVARFLFTMDIAFQLI